MRWSIVRTLYRKEMLETLRDRRTLIVMILLPIVMYPLFGIIATQAQLAQRRKLNSTRFTVGVVGIALPSLLIKKIQDNDKLVYLDPKMPWKTALRHGKLALVLGVKAGKKSLKHPQGQIKIHVYYATTQDSSRTVRKRVLKAFKWYQKQLVLKRLSHLKIPRAVIQPMILEGSDLSTASARGRYVLASIFPLLLLIMTITGAFYPAIDLTAGEKERGTLETLLTAPLRPIEIVAGKYFAVASIASMTGALNIVSMWLTFSQGLRLAARGSRSFSLGLTWVHMLSIMGFLLLVAAFAAAFMLAIASLARSFKEAQNFVTPAYLVAFLPIFITTLPGSKGTLGTSLVPLVNTAYAIKHTLRGTLTAQYLSLTLLSMGVAIAFTIFIASRIFAHEQVLFREGEYTLKGMLSRKDFVARNVPSVPEAIMLLSLQFLLLFYVGIPVQKANPAWGLVITLWLLILIPPLAFAWWRKIDFRSTFSLRRFPPIAGVGALLLVVGVIPWVVLLSQWIGQHIPGWQEFVKQAEKLFQAGHFDLSPLVFFFLMAISPGICEEIMFRGFIQSALLKRMRPWSAIVLTGFLFGCYHLSIYRLLPTTVLGILMGWLCFRTRSIYPAMLAHAANNGLALLLTNKASPQFLQTYAGKPEWVHLIIATVFVVGGIYIVFHTTQGKPPKDEEELEEAPPPPPLTAECS